MEEKKTVVRLPPWPLYDVKKTARWLEKMARQGLVLKQNGFPATLPLAVFEQTDRQNLRYCLVATRQISFAPEPETLAWNEARGWTYVARYGDYYVYRSEILGTEDLETDPAVLDTLIERLGIGVCLMVLCFFLIFTTAVDSVRDCLQWDVLGPFAILVGASVYAWFAVRYLKRWREAQE